MPYAKLSEINPALRGIKPPITLGQANLIASWADAMEGQEDGPESPWAVAISQFRKLYRVVMGRWVKKEKSTITTATDAIIELGLKSIWK